MLASRTQDGGGWVRGVTHVPPLPVTRSGGGGSGPNQPPPSPQPEGCSGRPLGHAARGLVGAEELLEGVEVTRADEVDGVGLRLQPHEDGQEARKHLLPLHKGGPAGPAGTYLR